MIQYKGLLHTPDIVPRLIGITWDDFFRLLKNIESYEKKERGNRILTVEGHNPRIRKVGAGRRNKLSLQDRLFMTLLARNIRVTHQLLGQIFGVHRCSVEVIIKEIETKIGNVKGSASIEHIRRRGNLTTVDALKKEVPEIYYVLKNS